MPIGWCLKTTENGLFPIITEACESKCRATGANRPQEPALSIN